MKDSTPADGAGQHRIVFAVIQFGKPIEADRFETVYPLFQLPETVQVRHLWRTEDGFSSPTAIVRLIYHMNSEKEAEIAEDEIRGNIRNVLERMKLPPTEPVVVFSKSRMEKEASKKERNDFVRRRISDFQRQLSKLQRRAARRVNGKEKEPTV